MKKVLILFGKSTWKKSKPFENTDYKNSNEGYYKKELIRKKYPFVNNLEFTCLIDDKLTTSLLFMKWSKFNWLIENKKDLLEILPRIKSGKVVLKPLNES